MEEHFNLFKYQIVESSSAHYNEYNGQHSERIE